MCGIAGEIRTDGASADPENIRRMMDVMHARGPDSEGQAHFGSVAFGHKRLAIVDLSERASQPMSDDDTSCCIVFNGCVYNHDALREELILHGHSFFSRSDTEVVLRSYLQWGKYCVRRFNGMFAFAIMDPRTNSVFLARDRLGIKPLYLQRDGSILRFASSLPALQRVSDRSPAIDATALHHYMTFHSVVPAPHTIVEDIRKLPPATRLTVHVDGGDELADTYWQPSFRRDDADRAMRFEDWRDATREALHAAVARRLTGDVPVGVLLSGGLDSSLIVGLLAAHGQTGLETFSVGFENRSGEEGNEFRYSDIVAQRFGTTHHKFTVDSGELLEHLPGCLNAMSEPMVSHDSIAFYLLSREVSKHVKVVQSGQGADEVFAGYHWYPPMLDSADPVSDYRRVFFDRDHEEFTRAVDKRYVNGDASSAFVSQHFEDALADDAIDKALHIDTTVMLIDDPVKRVDNMTMAWGLEARVPFLDHELVELAARMPPAMKADQGGKYVLKEMARGVIPDEVIDRPKGYFPVPELKYLSGTSLEFVRDTLNSRAAKERNMFDQDYLDELLDDPQGHLTPLRGSKLWQVGVLEAWCQHHLDTPAGREPAPVLQ